MAEPADSISYWQSRAAALDVLKAQVLANPKADYHALDDVRQQAANCARQIAFLQGPQGRDSDGKRK